MGEKKPNCTSSLCVVAPVTHFNFIMSSELNWNRMMGIGKGSLESVWEGRQVGTDGREEGAKWTVWESDEK